MSEASSDGVTFDANEPVDDPSKLGKSQYTKKTIFLSDHVPTWMKSLIPKSFVVTEEAWNAFPKTLNKYACSLSDGLTLDIQTVFLEGIYQEESPHTISSDMKPYCDVQKIVDIVDPAYSFNNCNSKVVLDYVPKKSGKSQLTPTWFEEAKADPDQKKYCHARKLFTFQIPWYMGGKMLESRALGTIINVAYESHVNTWLWQDEWYGLTMEDIRKLEEEAKIKCENLRNNKN